MCVWFNAVLNKWFLDCHCYNMMFKINTFSCLEISADGLLKAEKNKCPLKHQSVMLCNWKLKNNFFWSLKYQNFSSSGDAYSVYLITNSFPPTLNVEVSFWIRQMFEYHLLVCFTRPSVVHRPSDGSTTIHCDLTVNFVIVYGISCKYLL